MSLKCATAVSYTHLITQFAGQNGAVQFREKLEKRGIKVYQHYKIEGYPSNIPLIVSENGFGKNDYIETTRPLVVITCLLYTSRALLCAGTYDHAGTDGADSS